MKALEAEVETLKSRFHLQDNFINNQNKSLIESNKRAYELQCELRQAKVTIASLKEEIETLTKKSAEQSTHIIRFEKEKEEQKKIKKQTTLEKEHLLPKSEPKIKEDSKSELEKLLAEKTRELDSVKGKLKCFDIAEEHLAILREELSSKNKRLDSLSAEIMKLRDNQAEAINQPPQPKSMDDPKFDQEAEETVNNLQQQLSDSKVKVGKLTFDNMELKQQLEDANQALTKVQSSQSNSPKNNSPEISALKKEIGIFRERCSLLEENLESTKSELTLTESSNKELKTLMNSLQQQLDQSLKIKADLNNQLIEKDSLLIKIKAEIVDIK